MAARGELDAELGGDHSGAAVGGIAGNADFHVIQVPKQILRCAKDDNFMRH
jgi:hypothetical protein